jgi:hypothetical protein
MEKNYERGIDRIHALANWLIDHKVVRSLQNFETVCGLSKYYIKNLSATEKGNPGLDVVAKIYDVFPSVNLKWMVTGKGNMFTVRNEEELAERLRIDMVTNQVLSANKTEADLKDALKKTLQDMKDDLTAEQKVAILEKLLKS